MVTVKLNAQMKMILLMLDSDAITDETSIEQITAIEEVAATDTM